MSERYLYTPYKYFRTRTPSNTESFLVKLIQLLWWEIPSSLREQPKTTTRHRDAVLLVLPEVQVDDALEEGWKA